MPKIIPISADARDAIAWSRHPGGWVSVQIWRLHNGVMGPTGRFVLHSDELEAVSRALLAVRQQLGG